MAEKEAAPLPPPQAAGAPPLKESPPEDVAPVDQPEEPEMERVNRLQGTGLPRLFDGMSSVKSLIDQEYDRLREEWNVLMVERDRVNKIKERIELLAVNENDRLRINVSGQRFEINARSAMKNNLFRSLLTNQFAQPDSDGYYFFDSDPRYVMVILNHLRRGEVELDEYDDRQLRAMRRDAEEFMAGDLQILIDRTLAARRSGTGIVSVPLNVGVPTTLAFNGVFMELSVLKRNLALHSVSFVAGETRRIVAEAFCVEGSMDGSARPTKVGELEVDARKGETVTISFTAIALTSNVYTIGVYSSSCSTAVSVCPTTMANRDLSKNGLMIERSYHTTNSRGHWTRRAGQDEFDLVGDLAISS